jgi:D-serine deaminase-like pyridoxal phosphate-dependent protein
MVENSMTDNLEGLMTPALVLDRQRLAGNLAGMAARASELGVRLRPHMKTAKSADVARMACGDNGTGITVSTLAEAEYFADQGFLDIIYGVGIVPAKLPAVADIQARHGALVRLVLDDLELARTVAQSGHALEVLVEVDCGQHRAGLPPDSPEVVAIAKALADGVTTRFAGVMAHAGHSYDCRTIEEVETVAEAERQSVTSAAQAIREAGIDCDIVSVGSTPTALHARDLTGVTEMRPGVYMFGDRFQAAIGGCGPDDMALSVLASVIAVYPQRDFALLDAGALALSQDRSVEAVAGETSYGEIFDAHGQQPLAGLSLYAVNQEHGFVTGTVSQLEIGQRVRIFPNHACMTAAMYPAYNLVEGAGSNILARWPRIGGWEARG